MLKWMGAILVLSGAIGIGLWKKKQLFERVYLLRQLEKTLALMKSEIAYGQVAFPKILRKIQKSIREPMCTCISQTLLCIGEREGDNMIRIFGECMRKSLKHSALREEDLESVWACFSGIGFQDEKALVLQMERSMEELHGRSERLEKEAMAGGRIAIAFGGMVGAVVVVILL